ncbi:hypothetical protein CEY12_00795 [Chryseobacterium sp. T16E-39]|uniref:hypothetical protein n=1 Tax=Chryseobacterium sp. T16E-39 TaxID=2015076 RepID=UPI000B5B160E|nr:hypothetical protein [Chryseobacterium sp. T16E-39]ASK28737.1 hypothetical protein CEY12_00795 [Chryseobacterium sp. T16E-39]
MKKDKIIIGSYVNINGDRTIIDDQLLEKITNEEITQIEPIRLDDGWLNDFGFRKCYDCWRYEHSESKSVEIRFTKDRQVLIRFDLDGADNFFNEETQHVHMLQYLCFLKFQKMFSLDDN